MADLLDIQVDNYTRNGFSLDDLNKMNFNVFAVDEVDEYSESDPDLFFTNELNINLPSSLYVQSDAFKIQKFDNNLTIFNWNSVSVPENFQLVRNLYFQQNLPDILAICETRLSDEIADVYNIPEYDLHVTCRNRNGGGVLLFMKRSLESCLLKEFSYLQNDIEIVACEFSEGGGKSFIASIYRTPSGDENVFFSKLEQLLEDLQHKNFKYIYLVGDFNINILNRTPFNQTFVNTLLSHSLFPLCTKPTRVRDGSATLLDHVWSNNVERVISNQIILDETSDHFPVFTSFHCNEQSVESSRTVIKKRIFNETSVGAFIESLNEIDWSHVYQESDPNDAFSSFYGIYKSQFDRSFPLIEFLCKSNKKNKSQYVTPALKISITECKRLQRLSIKWPNMYKSRFKTYKSKLKLLLKEAESKFYSDKFKSNEGNMKKTWSLIGEILNKCKKKGTPKIIVNNEEATPDLINNYFLNSIKKIKEDQQSEVINTNESYLQYMGDETNFSMLLLPTTDDEIIKLCNSIKSNSCGCDEIPPKVFKASIKSIVKPLKYVINLALKQGIFPDVLKEAKVIPVHKSGSHSDIQNKRPVSVLNTLSMCFEKILYARFSHYFESNNLISRKQHGFRKGLS